MRHTTDDASRKPQDANISGDLFVFEGPKDVGKTTIIGAAWNQLSCELTGEVLSFAFPGRLPGTLGAHVYALHHDSIRFDVRGMTAAGLQALHVAAHLDAIEAHIRPALCRGATVLLDRYWWSTCAFGRAAGADPRILDALVHVEQRSWGSVLPRAVFLLDRETRDRSAYSKRVRDGYDALAEREASHVPVFKIRNDGPVETAVASVLGTIHALRETPVRQE